MVIEEVDLRSGLIIVPELHGKGATTLGDRAKGG